MVISKGKTVYSFSNFINDLLKNFLTGIFSSCSKESNAKGLGAPLVETTIGNKTEDKNIFDSMLEYSLFSNLMNNDTDYFANIANDNFKDFFGIGESKRQKVIKEENLKNLNEKYPIIFSKSDYKNFGVDIRRS